MTTTTATERRAAEGHARATLHNLIPNRRTIIHTMTDYRRRSETDYVRVFIVAPGKPATIEDISYYVATVTGRRMTPSGIAYRGGQYSKGLEAADDTWRARFGESLPQGSNWRELHSR